MDMKNTEIITALQTGNMSGHSQRFNPAPSGRPEFGQVYVIPSMLRDQIIKALAATLEARATEKPVAAKKPAPPKVKGKAPE